ncbi:MULTISPECIES: hypothetical protein [unclassified Bradyrhizobium]|uniref:hypothetical protein n=1 Tax=unclassified Bradyrhizobium TaxID=2631580 RepID=UPI0029166DE0|nr:MULTISPECIES: hypothetical protein [unclassified Bradyrhizobium]
MISAGAVFSIAIGVFGEKLWYIPVFACWRRFIAGCSFRINDEMGRTDGAIATRTPEEEAAYLAAAAQAAARVKQSEQDSEKFYPNIRQLGRVTLLTCGGGMRENM